mgnify:CR=1 FL=1
MIIDRAQRWRNRLALFKKVANKIAEALAPAGPYLEVRP